MTQEIKLGLVGYGTFSKFGGRGAGLTKLAATVFEGVRAVGICDNNPRALEQARLAFPEAGHYADYETMLDEVPMDALLIETPAYMHAEFAIKALERNIHVLSDIPCVNTVDEAWALWDAHLKSKAIYMTGANANLAGFWDAAVDLKRRGLFGEPYYIEAAYIHDTRKLWEKTPWRKPGLDTPRLPIQYCTHSLGPVLRLLDEDFEWVSCFDTGSHINKEAGQHDAMAALLRTKNNVVMRLLTSFINHYLGGSHFYRFFTTKGCFERTPNYRTLRKEPAESARTLFYSKELPIFSNWIELPIAVMPVSVATNDKWRKAVAAGIAHHDGVDCVMWDLFIKAIRSGGPSPISLKEGLRMTLPGIYAAESARAGGKLLQIKYPWTQAKRGT